MQQIQQITKNPRQANTFILSDGSSLQMTIRFAPMQYGWFIDYLDFNNGEFILRGLRITNSPNMLRQWKNIIPFGLACFSTGQREPSQEEDFSSASSILYLLTEAEVEEYEEYLSA